MNRTAALVPLLPRHVLKDNWTASMEKPNGKIIESAVEARGGFLGRPVLVVLVVSSLLVIAIFGGLYAYYFG
jgi:hypothetical protein